MSIKTRKHMRAVSLVMSIAIVGVLAAFLVLASNPGPTQAQDDKCAAASGEALELLRDLGFCTADTADTADTSDSAQDEAACATATGEALELLRDLGFCAAGGTTDATAAGNMITSDSSSGGGAPEFQVVIDSLPDEFGGGQLYRAVPGGRLPGARNDTGQFGVLCCGESDERGDGKWRPGVHHHCAES